MNKIGKTSNTDKTIKSAAKRKKREESEDEENYRLFFEKSSDAIFFTNPDGKIYKCNDAATKLFGYTEEEFREGGRKSIQDSSDPNLIKALEQREKTGEFTGVLSYIKKDGTRFHGAVQSKYYKLGLRKLSTF